MPARYDLSARAEAGFRKPSHIRPSLPALRRRSGIAHRPRERNLPPEEAIYQACVLRLRPIMMTTMCAILGGVPLMLRGGTGSELRQPLGLAVAGGLLVSQALTLFRASIRWKSGAN